jgi:hypothetical protein
LGRELHRADGNGCTHGAQKEPLGLPKRDALGQAHRGLGRASERSGANREPERHERALATRAVGRGFVDSGFEQQAFCRRSSAIDEPSRLCRTKP